MLGNEGDLGHRPRGKGLWSKQSVQNGVQEDEFGVGGCEMDWPGRASIWGNQRGQLRVMEESCVTLDWSREPWPRLSPEVLLDLQEGRRLGQMTCGEEGRESE